MGGSLVRIWSKLNIEEIKKHLFLAGELTASCENCQHIGIDFFSAVYCPECETPFKYLAFRKKASRSEELFAIARLQEKRPDITILDYEDIKHAQGKSNAQKLLGG